MADVLGYGIPQVIRRIMNGAMRPPISKARSAATAVGTDAGDVVYPLLRDTNPELLASMEGCLGPFALSRSKAQRLNRFREAVTRCAGTSNLLVGASTVGIVFIQ